MSFGSGGYLVVVGGWSSWVWWSRMGKMGRSIYEYQWGGCRVERKMGTKKWSTGQFMNPRWLVQFLLIEI